MAMTGNAVRKTLLVLVAIGILGSHSLSRGEEANWELLDSEPDHSDFYYNKSSISRSPEGITSVWAKVAYTEEGKADTLRILKAKAYENLAYSLYLYDIDCKGMKSHLKQIVHYDNKGNRIKEFNLAEKTAWEDIPINSRLESIADAECGKNDP
ncbi:MAG: hypothetical protein FD174_1281 [Geobacteraceae bacterium]|nr:MAG: hypothetical protein FD174_1281 [Geobacteraceae bacterium]